MAKKKEKSKTTGRGCGVTITLPTEPTAGAAKKKGIMGVLVQDEEDGKNVKILEYNIPLGQSITFRCGGTIKAYMQRIGDAPDTPVWMDADASNRGPVQIEFEHALDGKQKVALKAGQRLTINPVVARRWIMSAKNWE